MSEVSVPDPQAMAAEMAAQANRAEQEKMVNKWVKPTDAESMASFNDYLAQRPAEGETVVDTHYEDSMPNSYEALPVKEITANLRDIRQAEVEDKTRQDDMLDALAMKLTELSDDGVLNVWGQINKQLGRELTEEETSDLIDRIDHARDLKQAQKDINLLHEQAVEEAGDDSPEAPEAEKSDDFWNDDWLGRPSSSVRPEASPYDADDEVVDAEIVEDEPAVEVPAEEAIEAEPVEDAPEEDDDRREEDDSDEEEVPEAEEAVEEVPVEFTPDPSVDEWLRRVTDPRPEVVENRDEVRAARLRVDKEIIPEIARLRAEHQLGKINDDELDAGIRRLEDELTVAKVDGQYSDDEIWAINDRVKKANQKAIDQVNKMSARQKRIALRDPNKVTPGRIAKKVIASPATLIRGAGKAVQHQIWPNTREENGRPPRLRAEIDAARAAAPAPVRRRPDDSAGWGA